VRSHLQFAPAATSQRFRQHTSRRGLRPRVLAHAQIGTAAARCVNRCDNSARRRHRSVSAIDERLCGEPLGVSLLAPHPRPTLRSGCMWCLTLRPRPCVSPPARERSRRAMWQGTGARMWCRSTRATPTSTDTTGVCCDPGLTRWEGTGGQGATPAARALSAQGRHRTTGCRSTHLAWPRAGLPTQ
jgi:hypothetical protein